MRASPLILLLAPSSVWAATLQVGPTRAYTTIQSAINASKNGDVIEIDPATYSGKLTISKDITLVGVEGASSTLVRLGTLQSGAIATLTNADATIAGLTFEAGGRGLDIQGGEVTLEGIVVADNSGINDGIGLNIGAGAAVTITESTFEANATSLGDGGHIYVDGSDLVIEKSTFAGADAVSGGAIYVTGTSSLALGEVVFRDNAASSNGGAIFLEDGAELVDTDGLYDRNQAGSGGAVHLASTTKTKVTLDGSTFRANTATTGAALRLDGGTLATTGVIFKEQNAAGSAVHAAGAATWTGIADEFRTNTSSGTGGAIRVAGGAKVSLDTPIFDKNTGTDGGALHHAGTADLSLTSAAFSANTATARGGAIYWAATGTGKLVVTGSSFATNKSTQDGGAAWLGGPTAELKDNRFTKNTGAKGAGAAVSAVKGLTFERNLFCANAATSDGGGAWIQGTGGTAFVWRNNTLVENTATGLGGGVYVDGGANVKLVNNTFLGNAAGTGGGAYFANVAFSFTNNLVGKSAGAGLGANGIGATVQYGSWNANNPKDYGGSLAAVPMDGTNLSGDPLLSKYSQDKNCDNDEYWPKVGSPIVDKGDPAVKDPDGSRSDIGAYGGPAADPKKWADADGDKVAALYDCDDADPKTYPGAPEACDGRDHDCDGKTMEAESADAKSWYADLDKDGYGADAKLQKACAAPTGYVALPGDCNDADATFHPGATETCGDGVDKNCDGSTGNGDADKDGSIACEDCDDANPLAKPGGTEKCDGWDNDCDGTVDGASASDAADFWPDADLDGFGDDAKVLHTCASEKPAGYVSFAGDCADDDAEVHPGVEEICNGKDDDCSGDADGADATGALTWYADADADGHGSELDAAVACEAPAGYVADAGDCDDADEASYPGAVEVCADGTDNNCDGYVGTVDADEDGAIACDDCDDADADATPGKDELCDGVDNDCDGTIDGDNALDAVAFYPDADADGHGDDEGMVTKCVQPEGYATAGGDCDDEDAAYYPGAAEVCEDNTDNNCDGMVGTVDSDGDGVRACEDCDDTTNAVHPYADEICDALDNDCNGTADDDAIDTLPWHLDADGDGFGKESDWIDACEAPTSYISDATDCNDGDAAVNPGASDEKKDGIDQDCDGVDGRGGCGCSSTTGTPAGLYALATGLLALVTRRRRS